VECSEAASLSCGTCSRFPPPAPLFHEPLDAWRGQAQEPKAQSSNRMNDKTHPEGV